MKHSHPLTAGLFVLVLAASCQNWAAHAGPALKYPTRPVRIIVSAAPAGLLDIVARVFAEKLAIRLGGRFLVENITGGASNIAFGTAANSAPDGHTILVVSSAFVVNPSLIPGSPYDPIKSFDPVTLVATSPHVVVVHPSLSPKSMGELITLIRNKPKQYNYASPGTGTTGHLAGEMFRLGFGLDMVHVPFKGAAPAVNSIVAGHTPIGFTSVPPVAPLAVDGRLRALAVTTSTRSPALPDVPTLGEAGIRDQDSDVMVGVLVPAGTPKSIIDLLHAEIADIVATPEVKQRIVGLGFEPVVSTPDEFGARIKSELARWAKVIEESKIRAQQ